MKSARTATTSAPIPQPSRSSLRRDPGGSTRSTTIQKAVMASSIAAASRKADDSPAAPLGARRVVERRRQLLGSGRQRALVGLRLLDNRLDPIGEGGETPFEPRIGV